MQVWDKRAHLFSFGCFGYCVTQRHLKNKGEKSFKFLSLSIRHKWLNLNLMAFLKALFEDIAPAKEGLES